MNAQQLASFKQRLLDMQQMLGHRTENLIASIHEQDFPPGEHESHAPAGATESDWAVEQAEEGIGEQILAALERIGQGTFGVCQECGKEISLARLQAVPYAARCVRCERGREEQRT